MVTSWIRVGARGRLLAFGAMALVGAAGPSPARAAARCMAHMLADVPADEAPEEVKSKSNGDFGPVVLVKVNRQTGRMSYCARNSYCYNSNAFEFVGPCRIKIDKANITGGFFSYTTR